MTPQAFVSSLADLRFADVFNPYSDRCAVCDLTDAPRTRSRTLIRLLEAAMECQLDAIWIGRDLGYRGGRRTGLALTDDVHVEAHGARWGVSAQRPTKGEPIAERTAAITWQILSRIELPIFLWNVFPLHPHRPNHPFSNRSHNSHERHAGEEVLRQLVLLLRPRRLVAIGGDAAGVARRLVDEQSVVRIRHPSYGGQREFLSQVTDLYGDVTLRTADQCGTSFVRR